MKRRLRTARRLHAWAHVWAGSGPVLPGLIQNSGPVDRCESLFESVG